MPTALVSTAHTVDHEADELRRELESLQTAIASLENAVAEANRARGAAESDLSAHRVLLDEALELRAALEHRVSELEHELMLERTTSAIRVDRLLVRR